MTVTYTGEVSNCRWFGCFLKLLLRWKGSIYKLLWIDIIVYLCLYFSINIMYRFALEGEDKKTFENLVRYCGKYANLIPLSFVLGFYVSLVMGRWWNQYKAIPYPDTLAILVGSLIKGKDEKARLIRRTILRYVCLSFTMTLTMISPKVKKRFPDMNNLIEAGLLMQNEKEIFDDLDEDGYPSYSHYWLPLTWASHIATKARADGLLSSDTVMKSIVEHLNKFRNSLGTLLDYDWISVPLVYTQVVTLTVYSYFLTTLISRQILEVHGDNVVDLVFPIFTILEYFFYVGWLKVAESLINPFGEDDDDFEVVWLIDRNVQMSYTMVDKIQNTLPPLQKDKYWDRVAPSSLPYTSATRKYMKEFPVQSTRNVIVKNREMFEVDAGEIRKLRRRHTAVNLNRPVSMFSRFKKHTNKENGEMLDLIEEGRVKSVKRQLSEPIIQEIPILEEPEDKMKRFNDLKEQRLRERKEKFEQFLELMRRKRPATDEERIIEDILLGKNKK